MKQYRFLDDKHPTNRCVIISDEGDRLRWDDGVTTGEAVIKDGRLQFFAPSAISQSDDHHARWKKLPKLEAADHV